MVPLIKKEKSIASAAELRLHRGIYSHTRVHELKLSGNIYIYKALAIHITSRNIEVQTGK